MSAKDEREEEEEKEAAGVLPPTSLDASSSLEDLSLSSDGQPEAQKTEVEVAATSQADTNAASAGQELQPELPENQTLEGCLKEGEEKEGWSQADIKGAETISTLIETFSSVLAYHPQ